MFTCPQFLYSQHEGLAQDRPIVTHGRVNGFHLVVMGRLVLLFVVCWVLYCLLCGLAWFLCEYAGSFLCTQVLFCVHLCHSRLFHRAKLLKHEKYQQSHGQLIINFYLCCYSTVCILPDSHYLHTDTGPRISETFAPLL